MLEPILLEKLTDVPGVSGREQLVANVIRQNLPSEFDIFQDPLGNLVAHRPGSGPKVMLVSHMDEVGLMVQRISPQGFLLVERIGGISVRALPGSRMDLWTDLGRLPAQIGVLPGHLDHRGPTDLSKLYVDIGAESDQAAVDKGVQIGDVLTWHNDFQYIAPSYISSKALDDRLGCFALLSLVHELAKTALHNDLFLAFVTQEETMLSGGLPVIHRYKPDIVIGVDGTLSFDTPDTLGMQSDIVLGKGPVLKWMDAIRGKQAAFVPDVALNRQIRQIAKENNISLQHEVVTGISTAVTPIPYQELGIRTAQLSLPIRFHHTPIESANLKDVDSLISLLQEVLIQI